MEKASNLIKLDARSISHNQCYQIGKAFTEAKIHWAYRTNIKSWDLNHNKGEKSRSFSLLAIVRGKKCYLFSVCSRYRYRYCRIVLHLSASSYILCIINRYSTIKRLILSLQKNLLRGKLHDVNNKSRWSVGRHDVESVLSLENIMLERAKWGGLDVLFNNCGLYCWQSKILIFMFSNKSSKRWKYVESSFVKLLKAFSRLKVCSFWNK